MSVTNRHDMTQALKPNTTNQPSLPNDKIVHLCKSKALAVDKMKVTENFKFIF